MTSRNEVRVNSRNATLDQLSTEQLDRELERIDSVIFGSPEEREASRRVAKARQAAQECARCGGGIGDVVYRVRRLVGYFFGKPVYGLMPVCEPCAPAYIVRRDRRAYTTPDGYYRQRRVHCDSCKRVVVYGAADHDLRKRIFCSERCRWTYHNEQRSEAASVSREKTCEVCGADFTATRTDAKTCSPACKQKAYRQCIRGVASHG